MSALQNKITVTKAKLNPPPFINRSVTTALMITNNTPCALKALTLADYIDTYILKLGYTYDAHSAVMFYKDKKQSVKVKTDKNKITLKGILVPPRESVIVFYRLHKLTD